MALSSEGTNAFFRFLFRRLKNGLLVVFISLGLVFLQCQLRNQYIQEQFGGEPKDAADRHPELRGVIQPYIAESANLMNAATKTETHGMAQPNASVLSNTDRKRVLLDKINNFGKRAMEPVETWSKIETAIPNSRPHANRRTSIESVPKTMINPSSVTPRQHKKELRKFWLDKFTSQIPKNLQAYLQDILLRDFERSNTSVEPKRCEYGYFRLKGMNSCHKWLECGETETLAGGEVYGNGVGKIIHASKWRKKYDVAIVSLRKDRHQYKQFVDRVQSGVDNMLLAQSSPYATQMVGMCNRGNNTVLVMEGCKYGNFRTYYASGFFRKLPVIEKFKFAIQIVAEYDYVHRGLGLPRVNCDVHTIMQAFGQWIVSDDLRIFLNDLDELPQVDKKNNIMATCECEPYGKMEQPDFLAPEIRYTPEEYDKGTSRKPVDEASDIWKIPDITANIMVSQPGKRYFEVLAKQDIDFHFKSQLERIHGQCKRLNPAERPTAKDILIEYLKLYEFLVKSGRFD